MPIVVGQIGNVVLGFADTLMIGHHSMMELAAASFVTTMFTLIVIFAMGFSYGLTPIVGAMFGRGEKEEIGGILRNSLAANGLMAVMPASPSPVVFYLNLHRMGQPVELLPYMRSYLLVNIVSLPFLCMFNAFKQFYDGITDTRVPMFVILGGNVLNIFGNYVLIYGAFGMPELGLLGAGISTMVSRIVMFVAFRCRVCVSPQLCPLPPRICRRTAQPCRLPPHQHPWLARCHAARHGVRGLFALCHLRGLDWHNGPCRPSGYAHGLAAALYGQQRHGCRNSRQGELFPRTG